jgi:hypothetical protein
LKKIEEENVKLNLGIEELRNSGIGEESWNWGRIMELGKNYGIGEESWNWGRIMEFGKN